MCLTPIKLKATKGMVVPCGKCPKCKLRRAQSWIFRLLQEEKIHNNSIFLTLTYDDKNVPITKKGFMTLKKRDYQLFMKRLRKLTGSKTIKYYACGEYGTKTWRPHYHAIIYDVDHESISKAWGLGHIVCGTVTGDSIAYTTKYICKDKRVPLHTNDDRIPEFSLMSKNLGKNYLTPAMTQWHVNNQASYVVLLGGYKNPLPRYYRDKIFDDDLKVQINYANQVKHSQQLEADIKNAGSSTQFYRDRFEAIRHALRNNNSTKNRTKI